MQLLNVTCAIIHFGESILAVQRSESQALPQKQLLLKVLISFQALESQRFRGNQLTLITPQSETPRILPTVLRK